MNKDVELLEALIENCRWSDQVARLMGPEWDSDGRQLINLIWSRFYNLYSEWGTDMINEFITNYETAYYDENKNIVKITSVSQLMDILNQYKGED